MLNAMKKIKQRLTGFIYKENPYLQRRKKLDVVERLV